VRRSGASSRGHAWRAAVAALLLLVASAPAQSRRAQEQEQDDRPVYPHLIVPEDAVYGHLMNGYFKEPVALHFDRRARELLVADSKNGLIGIFDAEGIPVFAFGGLSVMTDPRRVESTPDGSILVLDSDQSELKEFSYRGEIRSPIRFAYPAIDDVGGGVARISAFTRDAAGKWYVADSELPQVLVYDAELNFEFAIRPDKAAARFGLISSLAVAPDGTIAVTDFRETPVQLFDRKGRFLAGWGERDIGVENFSAPADVEFDEEGRVFVVDMLRHNVKIFSRSGEFLGVFGGWFSAATGGRGPGEMLYPSGIAIEPGGYIYIVERFGGRVQMFLRKSRDEVRRASAPAAADEAPDSDAAGEGAEPGGEPAAEDDGN
jgi:DNA-binding beta-propeller fold protein YncE